LIGSKKSRCLEHLKPPRLNSSQHPLQRTTVEKHFLTGPNVHNSPFLDGKRTLMSFIEGPNPNKPGMVVEAYNPSYREEA
jgi:hypothetical protein